MNYFYKILIWKYDFLNNYFLIVFIIIYIKNFKWFLFKLILYNIIIYRINIVYLIKNITLYIS